jgi:hypothetical protein
MKAAIFAAFFCCVASFLGGIEVGWRQREAEPDKILTLTRTCPQPTHFKPAWDCGVTEAKEYCRACVRRKWL